MQTLCLNADYSPIGIMNWQKAVTLFFKEAVEIIESYDRPIRSVSFTMQMPAVVKVKAWVKSNQKSLRFNKTNIFLRDKGRCMYCSDRISHRKATYDHVIPRAKGGKTVWENIVTCCQPCNKRKDCRTPEEANMVLTAKPVKPTHLSLDLIFRIRYHHQMPDEWRKYILKE